jgi:MtrB/PioB family decaheme-associated outer membrane protein
MRNKTTTCALALAIAMAYAPARAEDEPASASSNTGVVSIGAAGVSGDSKDRSLFGQYNGVRKDDAYLMLDFLYSARDEATGVWTRAEGRNLGLDSREARAAFDRQGNWRVYGEYGELTRYYPRTINSALAGAGTTAPVVTRLATPGSGNDLDLKLERKRGTVGGEKWITQRLMVEASFTTEDKNGARIFGRGFTCASGAAPPPVCPTLATGVNQWAILMLPEPVDSTTRQIEARLNYLGERFALSAGYWGSFYENNNGAMAATINGNLNNPLGQPMGTGGGVALTTGLRTILQLPTALPPDNQAHQFSINGNYAFTPTTRATFRYAYTHATQHDDFVANGFMDAPAGRSNYGGVLDTTLAQAGLTMRPLSRLYLNANVRYEDREDKSPLALYNIEGTSRFTNGTYSLKKTAGKIEGTYQLPWALRATAGFDYESVDRGQFESPECIDTASDCVGDSVAGITALRAKTYEKTYRAELRRTMTETLSGSISYFRSDRDGSSWLKPNALPATGTTEVTDAQVFNRTGAFPFIFMNRKRDKVRALFDWSPAEKVSAQLSAEWGRDEYSAPTTKGLQDTGMRVYGIDVSYALAENWRASAYYTYAKQSLDVAHSTGYQAALEDRNSTAGMSLLGRATPKLQLGADFLYIHDRNIYGQTLDASASAANIAFLAASGGLPDVTFRDFRVKLFGKYALTPRSDLRLDVIHDRTTLNEWQWGYNGVAFLYSDNTTVSLQPNQNVTFLGLVYIYRFR